MVRLRVAELMKTRGISAYALAKGAGLNYPTAYRLSRPAGEFQRLEATTLDRVCRFFSVQPGDLLEWIPDRKSSTNRR
jgi:putative transcriptional regulator